MFHWSLAHGVQCEMCGQSVPRTRRFLVERSVLNVCSNCERFGKPLEGGGLKDVAPGNVPLALEQRRRRMGSQDVFASQQMQVELVPDFAHRIQAAREKKGWTRQDLGGRIGEPQTAIQRMESGALRPTDEAAKKMERELGIVLFEKVDAVATRPQAARSFTLGDVLRDALQKGSKK